MKNILLIIKNSIYRIYLIYFHKYIRLSSYPFVSGDSLRKISNHKLDEISKINPKKIEKNEIVFVKTDYLDNFFQNVFPHVNNPFILITHNSKHQVNKDYLGFLNKKEFKWYAQNLNFSTDLNERVFSIPLGIENRNYFKNGKLNNFNLDIKSADKKLDKIYCSLNLVENKNRVEILNIAKDSNVVDFKNFANHQKYINNLNEYKFSICPEGRGFDTHRFWECLIVNTIPVVKNSVFINNFEKIGVPMLKLDKWEDLTNYSSNDLSILYKKNLQVLKSHKFTLLDYWIKEIKRTT